MMANGCGDDDVDVYDYEDNNYNNSGNKNNNDKDNNDKDNNDNDNNDNNNDNNNLIINTLKCWSDNSPTTLTYVVKLAEQHLNVALFSNPGEKILNLSKIS